MLRLSHSFEQDKYFKTREHAEIGSLPTLLEKMPGIDGAKSLPVKLRFADETVTQRNFVARLQRL